MTFIPSPEAYVITFKSPFTKQIISFKAFLTSLSNRVNTSWNRDNVYGRFDPISTYTSTNKVISFAIDIPIQDMYEAQEILRRLEFVERMMYPKYDSIGGVSDTDIFVIGNTPIIGILFPPYIGELIKTDQDVVYDFAYGTIDNIGYDVKTNEGFLFSQIPQNKIVDVATAVRNQNFVPLAKAYTMSITLNMLHRDEDSVGFGISGGQHPEQYNIHKSLNYGSSKHNRKTHKQIVKKNKNNNGINWS